MDVLEAIKSRASYRGLFQNTPVSRADLKTIMEAGLAAPSGCNKQTVSLIAVDDPDLLARLIKLIDPPICETAPAMICVLAKRIIAYRDRSFYVQDYAAAIENMLLAAVGLNLSSCWVEGHITDLDNIGRQMADVLGVPKEYDLTCILPLGYAVEEIKHAAKKPFEERAWFNGMHKPMRFE
jgi:nitroreductase